MDRELFFGDVQQESRLCAPLHFSYTIEPISSFHQLPVEDVLDAVRRKFNIRCSLVVHRSSLHQLVVSFPDHAEASSAQQFAYENVFMYVKGCRYRFSMNDSPVYCQNISTDQRVILRIKRLLLHMWTGRIVEQILSPYCVVDYIEPATRLMHGRFICFCLYGSVTAEGAHTITNSDCYQ